MKLEMIESNKNSIRFKLSGISFNFANSLRRIAINSVDTFAIDSVTLYENSGAMFDEYLAHRIGLVPIHTPLSGYTKNDQIVFSMNASGPTVVYSKDLRSSDKEVRVANENIPIMKLREGQTIRLDGKAVMNNATRSAKFQPALVTYKALSDTDFEFYIESFGQLPPQEVLRKALSIITDDIKEVYKEVKKY